MTQGLPPMTSATGIGPLPDLLAECSGRAAVSRVFRKSNLPLDLIEVRTTRLPMASMIRLFSEATEAAADPLFGLRVGLAMEPEDYGLWMRYGLGARTLRTAIARLSWAISLHQTGPVVSLCERGPIAMWRYIAPRFEGLDPAPHVDHVVPTMIKIAQRYLGPGWMPAWVEVPYGPDHFAVHRSEYLGADWRVSSRGIGLPLTRSALDLPRPFTREKRAESITLCDVQATMRKRPSCFATAVADLISLGLLDDRHDIDMVANRLELPVRTLQRRLSEEGTTFSRVLESVRRAKAKELVHRGDMQVADIAAALGYSDPSNYRRASNRWSREATLD